MDLAGLLARCNFGGGAQLSLAVSGGADSVAMALLARETGKALAVWHVDHGVRASGAKEAEVVEALAGDLGASFHLVRLNLEDGADFEGRAREARYGALPRDVCVAHTADDRAETVLFNVLRGAGLAGAAAKFAKARRPIIALRRAETEAVCSHFGREVVRDPMNESTRFARVAMRKLVLPQAASALGRDPVPLLNRHADLVADALELVQQHAKLIDPTDAAQLRAAPKAVATEALRQWLMREMGSDSAVSAGSIERALEVASLECRATEIEGGYRIARTGGRLRLIPPA